MEERDHHVDGGVGGAANAVCIRGGFKARCVGVKRKKMRRLLMKLREEGYNRAAGGGGEMEWFEEGERKFTEFDSVEVEDVKHLLMRCKAWNGEREELMEKMKKVVTGLDEVEEEARILDLAYRNESIARGVENLWSARFVQK